MGQRSSESWGRASALLILACLDVSLVSLINLWVVQHSTSFVLHQMIILGICFLIFPIQLLMHMSHAASVFHWEVVPAINRPLMLWGEARHKHFGGALILHLQEMQATWGICMCGIIVTPSQAVGFALCALFTFILALYQ